MKYFIHRYIIPCHFSDFATFSLCYSRHLGATEKSKETYVSTRYRNSPPIYTSKYVEEYLRGRFRSTEYCLRFQTSKSKDLECVRTYVPCAPLNGISPQLDSSNNLEEYIMGSFGQFPPFIFP